MCFGSTNSNKPATSRNIVATAAIPAAAPPTPNYNDIALKIDGEYVLAATNKKGRRTVDAFDILGSLVRAKRDGNTSRVLALLDEYVTDFR